MFFFFFNDTATTYIYTSCHTLSLHDALPICSTRFTPGASPNTVPHRRPATGTAFMSRAAQAVRSEVRWFRDVGWRSEEHTSELQSLMRSSYAVFCLKKKKTKKTTIE